MDFLKLIDLILEIIQMPLTYLISPNKRVFFLYMFTSFLLALYVYYRTKEKSSFVHYFFSKKRWLGNSAVVDYGLIFFNSFIKVVILSPLLIYALYIAEGINEYCVTSFGLFNIGWSTGTIVILYTITIVVVNDFFSFIVHYMMHKIPFLWEFHKIHHSATSLTPFTQYRIHPVELILNNVRGLIIKGIITGVFLYLADGRVSILTFIGVNVLNFLFYFFGANLRHSHVKLKYFGFLENILISPFQHQIHRSNEKEHFDTNFGSRLAIWDCFFGTLIKSNNVKELTFGLGEEDKEYNSFLKNLISPFKNLLK
ncbi:MAG: sterol desaturase family protein [Flavobacteriales bacterium]|nr:sterol desaturase family protein [Flavobacteriales bacterium]